MNAMLMNLGLAPIPPVPAFVKPKCAPKSRAKKKNALSSIEICALMRAKNLERVEQAILATRRYIRENGAATTRSVSFRFDWTYAKAADIIHKMHKRNIIKKIGAGKAVVWVLDDAS